MQLNYFKTLFFCFILALFTACTSSSTTVVVTSDATFNSLVLVNSNIANLSTAVFSVVPGTVLGDTIVNLDSLPFGIKVNKIIPVLSFKSSYKTILNDTISYTGKDSTNFTKICKVLNYASDQTTTKKYIIKVNVHKVNPELYKWVKLDSSINVLNALSQKAILLNNKIYYFMNDGSSTTVQTSIDGKNWDAKQTITGLPNTLALQNMTVFNSKLYLALNDSKLYSTADGINWISEYDSPKYKYTSILFALNGNLNLITQTVADKKYHLGVIKTSDISNVLVYTDTLSAKFPITDFTALSYTNRTGINKGIVIGGKGLLGDTLKTNWNTEDGALWVNFSRDSRSLDNYSLLGTSVISYDNKLLLFGSGVNTTANANYLVSKDEGFSWNVPDSSFNYLQKDTANHSFLPRSYQSVLVQNPMVYKGINNDKKDGYNNIFIIGGKVASTYSPQIWKGKLNRLNFIRQ